MNTYLILLLAIPCMVIAPVSSMAVKEDRYRLVNGTAIYNGRVEVYHRGIWGTINGPFNHTEVGVLCRSLGYSSGMVRRGAYYGEGVDMIWFESISCKGDEYSLSYCRYLNCYDMNRGSCSHTLDVSVDCIPTTVTIRLSDRDSGRVNVLYNRTWGTVCDKGNNSNITAHVICRSLGFSDGTSWVTKPNRYDPDLAPIWLSDVKCDASDYSLAFCDFNGWGINTCTHDEDLWIRCGEPTGCKSCKHRYYCDIITDICTCETGWMGILCDQDIDECIDDDACPDESFCINTGGSYYCEHWFDEDDLILEDFVLSMDVVILISFVILTVLVCWIRILKKKKQYQRFSEPSGEDLTAEATESVGDQRVVGTVGPILRSEAVESDGSAQPRSAVEDDAFSDTTDGYGTNSHTYVKSIAT